MEQVHHSAHPALLDPLETKRPFALDVVPWTHIDTTSDAPVAFRHSGWRLARAAVQRALVVAGIAPRRIDAFDVCGTNPWLVQSADDPTEFKIRTACCHSRWCVPCNATRSNVIAVNLHAAITDDPHQFVTLTLKHRDTPLSSQIDLIYDCFRRLRKHPYWTDRVSGGGVVLEIKRSRRTDQWHPHLHMVTDSRRLEKFPLSNAWYAVTGDSFIVDVGPIEDRRDVARYVTKYVTKPIPHAILKRQPLLVEMIQAMDGRRTVLTFGSWRGIRLSKPLSDTVWENVCTIERLFERVASLDPEAIAQHRMLVAKWPAFMAAVGPGPPDNLLPF